VAGEDLSLTFAALADPTRRAILERLAFGAATVTEIAEPFAMTQQAICKHLKVLERAGLISRSRAAQSRPCQLEDGRLGVAADWISRNRRMWQEQAFAVERTVPFAMLAHTIIIIWSATAGHHPADIDDRRAAQPWYRTKTEPAFEDILIKLRRTLIAARFSGTRPAQPTDDQIRAVLAAWDAAAAQLRKLQRAGSLVNYWACASTASGFPAGTSAQCRASNLSVPMA
jgi:DNA-binding transcriptional ArsR family regulator